MCLKRLTDRHIQTNISYSTHTHRNTHTTHTRTHRTLEIQIAEYQGESSDRLGELEAHSEASDKFAAKV
jgi:hypothetical protein